MTTTEKPTTDTRFVSKETWLAARRALLEEEKAATRERDRLAARRRALPPARVDADYRFMTEAGACGLDALFGDHDQLVVYHFMYGVDWEKPCLSCSFWADGFDGVTPHLAARGVGFVAVSHAPLERLAACKAENGWRFDWASAVGPAFRTDFGVFFEGEDGPGYNYSGRRPSGEMPGLSVFVRGEDGAIGHAYSTYARGLEGFNVAYQLLDLTPRGRDEAGLPWPMAWVRRPADYASA